MTLEDVEEHLAQLLFVCKERERVRVKNAFELDPPPRKIDLEEPEGVGNDPVQVRHHELHRRRTGKDVVQALCDLHVGAGKREELLLPVRCFRQRGEHLLKNLAVDVQGIQRIADLVGQARRDRTEVG
jgi:hypothetical protein